MSFCDIRGETIDVGTFIRYTGTGTISKVVELKEEDNEQWVKLDEPALWYAADSLMKKTSLILKTLIRTLLSKSRTLRKAMKNSMLT